MNDTAYAFLKLYPRQSKIASAILANDTNITSDTHHTKAYTFGRTRVWFFHFEYIANKNLLYRRHANTSKKDIYTVIIPQIAAFVQPFLQKNIFIFPLP